MVKTPRVSINSMIQTQEDVVRRIIHGFFNNLGIFLKIYEVVLKLWHTIYYWYFKLECTNVSFASLVKIDHVIHLPHYYHVIIPRFE